MDKNQMSHAYVRKMCDLTVGTQTFLPGNRSSGSHQRVRGGEGGSAWDQRGSHCSRRGSKREKVMEFARKARGTMIFSNTTPENTRSR